MKKMDEWAIEWMIHRLICISLRTNQDNDIGMIREVFLFEGLLGRHAQNMWWIVKLIWWIEINKIKTLKDNVGNLLPGAYKNVPDIPFSIHGW